MRFGFVILHYNTIDDTRVCISSIRKHMPANHYDIVVVDNASTNNTGEILKAEYAGNKDVKVLINKENLGFAKGNNIGIKYLRDNKKDDFIIVLNNDTKLLNDDLPKIVINEYLNSHFAIMGPKILLPENESYYLEYEAPNKKKLKKTLWKYRFLRILNYLNLRDFLYNHLQASKIDERKKDPEIENRHEDIMLNGCFLIFSPKFFEYYEGFNSRTFMYREEEFLYYMCKQKKLKMVYNPKLVIYHNEDSSTNALCKTNKSKNEFFYKNSIASIKQLIDFLNDK